MRYVRQRPTWYYKEDENQKPPGLIVRISKCVSCKVLLVSMTMLASADIVDEITIKVI